jgi:hypothetical protein
MNIINTKQNEIMTAKSRYVNGLEKLAYAESQVAIMRRDLEELQPQLIIASAQTEEMLKTIAVESKEAEIQRKTVSAEEAIANEKAMQAQGLLFKNKIIKLKQFFLNLFYLVLIFLVASVIYFSSIILKELLNEFEIFKFCKFCILS